MASTVSITRFINNLPSSTGVVSVTVGITRDSDGATILAPASATTNPSAGVYSYDYAALGLDASLTYTATFTVTDTSGANTLAKTISGVLTRRTLRYRRRALALDRRTGPYTLATTTSAATGTDANRTLICAELADLDADADKYDAVYAYLANGALAGQQARVVAGGFTGSLGQLLLNRYLATTPQSGVQIELHHRLPAIAQDGDPGLREVINRSLDVLYFVRRVSFVASGDLEHYAAPWWVSRQSQVGPIYAPNTDATRNPLRWEGNARLRLDSEIPLLELGIPVASGSTFWVDFARPCSTYIKHNGAWADSTSGLVDDDDECMGDEKLVTEAALAYYYAALESVGSPPERGDPWGKRAATQNAKAAALRGSLADMLDPNNRASDNQSFGWGSAGRYTARDRTMLASRRSWR